MTRRCSQCSANGHNARTCPARGGAAPGPPCVKLFGVRIAEGAPMKRSASVGCLSHCSSSSVSSPSNREDPAPPRELEGYVSDETHHASCSSSCRTDRKKGTPWTEDEHRMFLVGLQKLGKGDWRGISRNYVISRTPTQVASHAQKYFIRQTNAARRKRRSSLFDMVTNMPGENTTSSDEQIRLPSPNNSLNKENTLPIIDLNLQQESIDMETVEEAPTTDTGVSGLYNSYISEMPPLCPPGASVPLPFWPAIATTTTVSSPPIIQPELCDAHEVIKPTPILRKVPVHLDELANMSKLCLGEASGDCMESSSLSVELRGFASSPRRSAFHSSSAVPQPSMSPNEVNVIHAV